jgi:Bacterial antitoxin of type II TA system, VapB
MAVTQIDIDQDALDRAMALSNARTKKDVVNLALRPPPGRGRAEDRRAVDLERPVPDGPCGPASHRFCGGLDYRCHRCSSRLDRFA